MIHNYFLLILLCLFSLSNEKWKNKFLPSIYSHLFASFNFLLKQMHGTTTMSRAPAGHQRHNHKGKIISLRKFCLMGRNKPCSCILRCFMRRKFQRTTQLPRKAFLKRQHVSWLLNVGLDVNFVS
jgi:hypothetical protein